MGSVYVVCASLGWLATGQNSLPAAAHMSKGPRTAHLKGMFLLYPQPDSLSILGDPCPVEILCWWAEQPGQRSPFLRPVEQSAFQDHTSRLRGWCTLQSLPGRLRMQPAVQRTTYIPEVPWQSEQLDCVLVFPRQTQLRNEKITCSPELQAKRAMQTLH